MPPLSQVPRQDDVVVHHDSILRFDVRSRSESGVTRFVDLGDDRYPFGSCTCRHFVTTCGPAQRRGERKMCYHILRAREAFLDWAIQAFKDADKNDPV